MQKLHSQGAKDFVGARRLLAALGLAAALFTAVLLTVLSSASAAPSSVTKTFNATGAEQVFTVPDGVTSLDVVAVGGRGGAGAVPSGSANPPGGFGAVARAELPVTPGQNLYVRVGGNGALVSGGFNGGGDGGTGNGFAGGGGGGSTDIRTKSGATTIFSRLITAGGGGGGGGSGFEAPGGVGGQAGEYGQFGQGAGSSGSPGSGTGSGTGGHGGYRGAPGGVFYGFGNHGSASGSFNGSGGGGGSGDRGGDGGGAGEGPGIVFTTWNDGGGGGGGGGSTEFALTANDRSIETDTTGVPLLRITYKTGGAGSKSGLKYGKLKLNKAKGTAILPVTVPGSGNLSIGGSGVVHKRSGLAGLSRLARAVTTAGTYKLTVKAKGKSKRKLLDTGKVKVKAVVTFKPSSGDAVHDTRKITLKKN